VLTVLSSLRRRSPSFKKDIHAADNLLVGDADDSHVAENDAECSAASE
jgi:hypothetical protein